MKILLLGASGQVGWELQRSLSFLGELVSLDRSNANLEDSEHLDSVLHNVGANYIVNAAAYTNVDGAEKECAKAFLINAKAVDVIAKYAKKKDATFIHYSTDYVFDGEKESSYVETDQANPLNAYGKSKLDGELAIQESACKHLILRTSWVYSARGSNFIKTILRISKEKDEINVVHDQYGAPTSAELIADVTASLIQRLSVNPEHLYGTYNLVSGGETTWYEYAKFILSCAQKANLDTRLILDSVHPIRAEEYSTPAKRPQNSRLCIKKISKSFNIEMPSWEKGVSRTINELLYRS